MFEDEELGSIAAPPPADATRGTLDEPVSVTILRDVKRVGEKLRQVLFFWSTQQSDRQLRDWDLWGPLILCLLLATSLSWAASSQQSALAFAAVFIIVWCGAGFVTLNALLLGGKISFLQSVCVLGYCIAPLTVASIFCHFWGNGYFHFILVCVSFGWSTRASVGFMQPLVPEDRRALGVYPTFLFYMIIGWMIFMQ